MPASSPPQQSAASPEEVLIVSQTPSASLLPAQASPQQFPHAHNVQGSAAMPAQQLPPHLQAHGFSASQQASMHAAGVVAGGTVSSQAVQRHGPQGVRAVSSLPPPAHMQNPYQTAGGTVMMTGAAQHPAAMPSPAQQMHYQLQQAQHAGMHSVPATGFPVPAGSSASPAPVPASAVAGPAPGMTGLTSWQTAEHLYSALWQVHREAGLPFDITRPHEQIVHAFVS